MAILNTIKVSAFALISGVLIAAPAFAQNAAGTTQVSKQQYGQVGVGNVGIVDNGQLAITDQSGFVLPGMNGASTTQLSNQKGIQTGDSNYMGLGSQQTSDTTQSTGWFGSPIDGAKNQQMSDQGAGQNGIGNTLDVNSNQTTSVFQF